MSQDNSELAKQAKARGNKHFAAKNWDGAITEYSTAIELLPESDISHTFYSNRSACYAEQEDYERALADGLKCTKLKPDFSKGYSRVGLAYFKMGKYEEAKKAYEDGLKIDPNNGSLKNGLEETERAQEGGGAGAGGGLFGPEIWMQIHSHPELKQYASDPDFVNKVKMLQTNPQMAMQMGLLGDEKIKKLFEVMLGMRFGGTGDDADGAAASAAGGGVDDNTNDNENENDTNETNDDTNMRDNGTAGSNDNNTSKSSSNKEDSKEDDSKKENEKEDNDVEMTEEEKEEKKRKEDALKHKDEGNKLYKEKKFEEAIEEYKKAQELDPRVPAYALNHSAVLFAQQKWDECIDLCQKAVDINASEFAGPQWSFKAYHRMGKVEETRKNWDNAISYYKKALLEQNDANLRKHVRDLEKWLKKQREKEYVDPEKAKHHKEEGNRLFKLAKFEDAIEEYTEAIKRNPKDAVLYSNRATAFCKVMRWDAAMEDCEKCLKMDPKFVKAWIRKGKIQHVTKQYHKALESFRKAEEIDPTIQDLISAKRDTLAAIQERNHGQVDEKARAQALQDPEVQAAMNDPEVSSVLLQAQSGDPTILYKAMRDRPHIAKKIETLIAAGVLQVK